MTPRSLVCVARKKTGRRTRTMDGRPARKKKTRAVVMEDEGEKGREAGGEEEREKIDEGRDGLSIAAHGCIGIARHLSDLSTVP